MSEEKKIPPVPALKFPDDKNKNQELEKILTELKHGSEKQTETELSVVCIRDKNLFALVINILSVAIVFFVGHFILSSIKRFPVAPALSLGLPLVATLAIVLFSHQRMWTKVDGLKALLYLDTLHGTLMICYPGFHFIPWYAAKENRVIPFDNQKITASREKKNPVVFKTSDKLDVEADVLSIFKLQQDESSQKHSLPYSIETLNELTLAYIVSRLAALGACNSYETLRQNKTEVVFWVAGIFAGEGQQSEFEKRTGTQVSDPILEDFDLTKESQQIYSKKAEANVFVAVLNQIKEEGVSPDEASHAALAVTKNATRNISTTTHVYDVRGLPSSVHTFAPGGEIATRGGK